MASKEFTFTGSEAQGPSINLVEMSGLKFTEEERERLWQHISPRTFLVDHLKVEELSDQTPGSDSDIQDAHVLYRYNSKEGFVYALRNGLLALLRDSETLRSREAKMPNHKLKRHLLAVGHGCFVSYYYLFANQSLNRETVVSKLRRETSYTEQSCMSRTVKARNIIDAGRGVDALRLIVSSPTSRLSPEALELAQSLLDRKCGVRDQLLSRCTS